MDLKISKDNFFGPNHYSPKKLVQELERHPDIVAALKDFPEENTKEGFNKTAIRGYLNELIATPSTKVVDGMTKTLQLLWYKIFNGIDVVGLDELRPQISGKQVIYVPCHRSHLDYLLISFVLHMDNMALPHIIAGNNLNISGVGRILKGGGAIFMKRSFRDKPLYGIALRTYLNYLLDHQYPMEVFLEGGRSRTGKNLKPKIGILGMLAQYMLERENRDLHIVPISIAYERIPEESSYIKELEGAEKRKENIFELLNSYKVLKKNFGKVFVTFAPPMSMRKMQSKYVKTQSLNQVPEFESEEFNRMIYSFGTDIMDQINSHMRISAVPVVATALLSDKHQGFRREALLQKSQFLVDLYQAVHPRAQETLVKSMGGLNSVIDFFIESGLVACWRDDDEDIYYFKSRNKIRLNIYKNIFAHHYVIPSIICHKLLQTPHTKEALLEDLQFFEKLLRHEFMFPRSYSFQDVMETLIDFLIKKGLVVLKGTEYHVTDDAVKHISMLARIILPFIESFQVAIYTLQSKKVNFPLLNKSLIKLLREEHQKLLLLGKIDSIEGNLTVSYQNIISFFTEENILEKETEGKQKNVLIEGDQFKTLLTFTDKL